MKRERILELEAVKYSNLITKIDKALVDQYEEGVEVVVIIPLSLKKSLRERIIRHYEQDKWEVKLRYGCELVLEAC